MPDRKRSFPTTWLAPALALLAWASAAPSCAAGRDVDCRPTTLRAASEQAALPSPPPPMALGAPLPSDVDPRATDIASEGEEQDQVDALGSDRTHISIPWTFRTVADLRPTAPRPIPAPYPLRC